MSVGFKSELCSRLLCVLCRTAYLSVLFDVFGDKNKLLIDILGGDETMQCRMLEQLAAVENERYI